MKKFIYTTAVILFSSVLISCSAEDDLGEMNIDSTETQSIGKTDNVHKGNPFED